VWPVGEKKVPEVEHLREWRSRGAKSQNRRESIQLGIHSLAEQVVCQFRFDDLKALVDKLETPMNAVHGVPHITRALFGNKVMEKGKSFDLAARSVQEGRTQNVHALHVDGRISGVVFGGIIRNEPNRRIFGDWRESIDGRSLGTLPLPVGSFRLPIMHFPRNSIKKPNKASFCDAALEERICGQGTEGIISDFGVSRGPAPVHQRKVFVRRKGRDIQKSKPHIYAVRRLFGKASG
jgi:hypothetical protein